MAILVPSAGAATAKWQSRAVVSANDYKTAVAQAGGRWQGAVDQSGPAWDFGVSQAMSNNSYPQGVQGKGGTYQTNAADKGFRNYGPGVQGATNAFNTAIGKVLNVIAGLTLPPKGGPGNPANLQRASIIDDALHAAKLAGQFR